MQLRSGMIVSHDPCYGSKPGMNMKDLKLDMVTMSPDGKKFVGLHYNNYYHELFMYDTRTLRFITKVEYDNFEWSDSGFYWSEDGNSLIVSGHDTSGDPCTRPHGHLCQAINGWKGIPLTNKLPLELSRTFPKLPCYF